MANIVGSLKVLLGLDATEYTAGFSKAEVVAEKFAQKQARNSAAINRQVLELKRQAAMLGMSTREARLFELAQKGATAAQLQSADAALRSAEAHERAVKFGRLVGAAALAGAAGLVFMTKSAIDSADHLHDLSKATGIAVETLGGIGFAASQSGSDLDSVAGSLGKLNLKIAEAARGEKDAVATFKAIGISVRDASGAAKKGDVIFAELAGKFESYADGPEKAALGNALFGKSYQSILPLLADGQAALEENIAFFQRFGGVTEEVARQSDEFNDTIGKISLITGSLGRTIAAELLPSLQGTADAMLHLKQEGGSFVVIGQGVKTVFDTLVVLGANVAFVFKYTALEVYGLGRQLAALATLDFKGFTAISDAMKADAARARAELDAFEKRILLSPGSDGGQTDRRELARRGRKTEPFGVSLGAAPKLPGSGADGELKKRLDGQLKDIREFADQQREAFQFANQYLKGVYDEGLISLRQFFDDQRAVRDAGLQATVEALDKEIATLRAHSGKVSGADRVEAENKVAEAVAKRSAAVKKAGQDGILSTQEEARALLQLGARYDDLRVKMLELSGDTESAARARIAQQVAEAQKLVTQVGGNPADVDRYRSLLTNTEALNKAQADYNRLLERARDEEEAILIAARSSGASELEVMRAVGAARQRSLADLDALVQKANELALTLGTPEAVRFAEQLGLAFKRAAGEVDPLLLKIRDVSREMADSISSGFEDAIVEGKSLRDMLKGIEQDIVRIVTRRMVTKPLGDAIDNFLGGTGGSGGFLGNIFSSLFGGGRAGGGGVERNSMYEVAENRPEMLDWNGRKFLLMGNQRGRIDPNPRLGGGGGTTVNHLTFNLPEGGTRLGAAQLAAEMQRRLSAGNRNR